MKHAAAALLLVVLSLSLAGTVLAQRSGTHPRQLEGVGVEEHLGDTIPMDLRFTNSDEANHYIRDDYREGWRIPGLT